jgi:hypothetical protein
MTALLLAALAGAMSLRTEVGIGGDYTTQRYKVVGYDTLNWNWLEEDTLDIETEGRTSLAFRFALDGAAGRFSADNAASVSTRSARDGLSLWYERALGPALNLRAGNDAELRHYHRWFPGLADTLYGGRSHWSNSSRLELRLRAGDALRLTLTDGFELLRYAEPDSWYSDYQLNRARLAGWWEPGLLTTVDFGGGWSWRRADRDAGRDYDEYAVEAGLEQQFDGGLRLGGEGEHRQRRYRTAFRSSRQEAVTATAGLGLGSAGLALENESRWTVYDSAVPGYASLFENGLRLTFELAVRPEFILRAGPRADLGVGLAAPGEDDYRELSVAAGLDAFRADRFWLSFEDRLGRRSYPHADTAWQSDYTFNELSLFANWTALRGRSGELRLEAMASVTPEWHARRTDDLALAVIALDLKYGF